MAAIHVHANMMNVMRDDKILLSGIWETISLEMKFWVEIKEKNGASREKVKGAQPCLTLCNPTDYIVHGILQARILEWAAFPFSRESSQSRDRTQIPILQEDSLPGEPKKSLQVRETRLKKKKKEIWLKVWLCLLVEVACKHFPKVYVHIL